MKRAIASNSLREMSVPVGLDGVPRMSALVRAVHASRTIAAVGWKLCAAVTASGRARPSNARTKWR